jgi:hypothetical protein
MAQIVMSPNPKVIKKFINGNGTTFDGGVDEALGTVAGLHVSRPGESTSVRGTEEVDSTPKKICLECSSEAKEGSNYCSFCSQFMK